MIIELRENTGMPNATEIPDIICGNRNIDNTNNKYIQNNPKDIETFINLNKEKLAAAADILERHLDEEIIVVVDADLDGFASSSLLINYLYSLTESKCNIKYFIHADKTHGISDAIEYILDNNAKLVIAPDSSSNEGSLHAEIVKKGIDFIALDHHEYEYDDSDFEHIVIINSQDDCYHNKFLAGAGVTWQFCRYLDNYFNINLANDFIDLAALGCCGDMMSMKSLETKQLILQGFEWNNIKNPFIKEMSKKNEYSMNKGDYKCFDDSIYPLAFTPIAAAFFIVPFVNAMTRSGTVKEQTLVFESMLNHMAYTYILSNKRGHKLGEEEYLITQALRTCTNVKNRQEKEISTFLPILEQKIQENNMLNDKVLLFTLEGNQVRKNIAGLCANKMAARYQRPCIIISDRQNSGEYSGSLRGYANFCDSLKDVLNESGLVTFAMGHASAAGCGSKKENIILLRNYLNEYFKDKKIDISFDVDFIWDYQNIESFDIIKIAEMNNYIGTDFPRPYVCVKHFTPLPTNFKLMKSNTFKFEDWGAGFSMIMFNGDDQFAEDIYTNGEERRQLTLICKCSINEWGGDRTPQLIIEAYEWENQTRKGANESQSSIISLWDF